MESASISLPGYDRNSTEVSRSFQTSEIAFLVGCSLILAVQMSISAFVLFVLSKANEIEYLDTDIFLYKLLTVCDCVSSILFAVYGVMLTYGRLIFIDEKLCLTLFYFI